MKAPGVIHMNGRPLVYVVAADGRIGAQYQGTEETFEVTSEILRSFILDDLRHQHDKGNPLVDTQTFRNAVAHSAAACR